MYVLAILIVVGSLCIVSTQKTDDIGDLVCLNMFTISL